MRRRGAAAASLRPVPALPPLPPLRPLRLLRPLRQLRPLRPLRPLRRLRPLRLLRLLPLLTLLLLLLPAARAACPVCPPPPARCHYNDNATGEECFYDIDDTTKDDNFVINISQNYVGLTCVPGMSLDSPSLPRFPHHLEVSKAVLTRCGPPAVAYAALLARLNVTVLDSLQLVWLPAATLRAAHLAGLAHLTRLALTAADGARPDAAADLLAATPALTHLTLAGVRVPAAALARLPPGLTSLTLTEPGLTEPPGVPLPRLASLVLRDRGLPTPPELRSWPALRQLVLIAPNASGTLAPAALEKLTIECGPRLRLAGECRLRELTLVSANVSAVPAAWLADCSRLTDLTLRLRNLTALTGAEFSNLTSLSRLKMSDSLRLRDLPPQLFRATRNLNVLDLSRNNITRLPSNIFSRLTRLQRLDLSYNALRARSEDALWPLSALTDSLRTLSLAYNPLGDLCAPTSSFIGGEQLSWLPRYKTLKNLRLAGTGARSLCADWRGLPTLQELDLRGNLITELQWSDLQWSRRDVTHVRLAGNPLRRVLLSRPQYERARAAAAVHAPTVQFELNETLVCDCLTYWFAVARRDQLLPVSFVGLSCLAPRGDRSVPFDQFGVENMVCPLGAEAGCPAACSCWGRARDGRTVVNCTGRGLRRLPELAALTELGALTGPLELLAADNLVATLPAALPARLLLLDLRRNRLSGAPAPAAAALPAPGRSLLLGGNPLHCRCAAPLLTALADRLPQVLDAAEVVCADGRPLAEAARAACGAPLWAVAAAGALLLGALLAAAAALLLRPHARLRLKAALLARGLCLRWAAPRDRGPRCDYDAFLSYSHLDGEVADALVRELESGPRPLRLCVHHRDWRVGGWIHAQIAESVARSRRTVILLSENFARSQWARAEFREAYARALDDDSARLVVVLLGDAPPPGLDPELQHYIAHNTYVRWGDPAFWEKLRLALPPGRPRPAPAAPAAPSAVPMPAPPPRRAPAAAPAPPAPPPPAPQTPIVKFSQIDFPAPLKPPKNETSACA